MDCRYFWLLLWVEITHSNSQKLPKGAQQIVEKGTVKRPWNQLLR